VSAGRYTVVFTGLYELKRPGEYPYLTMGEDASGGALRRGRPPYSRLGHEVHFKDLPEGCRDLILRVYRELWGL
jgi:hypothetical protein